MKKIAGLILMLVTLAPSQMALAGRAQIMLLPTRVVMENGDRYVTIIVRNTGDATGNMNLELIDMAMDGSGKVMPLEPGETDPYSAIPYLRISPLSISLKPQGTQNVRILLRKPQDLSAGEYRSHLKVKIKDDDAEGTAERAVAPAKEAAIVVKAILAFTIPVIVRTGETNIAVKMEDLKLTRNEQGRPVLELVLLRSGNRSVMGDFTISHSSAGEKPVVIKTFPGVPVYRNTDRRQVSIVLDELPAGTDLSSGKLSLVYTAQNKEGGMKLAESDLTLSGN